MTRPQTDSSVLVIGAGPAGATTALLLARSGLNVTLIERETDFDRVFRGEGLMPGGIDALYQMGLGKMFQGLQTRKMEAWEMYIDGQKIFTVPEPYEALGDRAMRVIPQPAFLTGVVEIANQYPGFHFESGVIARDLLREGERVVGVQANTSAGACELRADFVIGCDGRHSLVRKQAGLALDLLPEHYDVLWFKMPPPARLQARCTIMIFGATDHAGLCYLSWDGLLRFALAIPKAGGYQAVRDADWAELLGQSAPAWLADHLRSVREAIEGPNVLNVIVGRCPQWNAPGLLLLGDAAHPMSPIRAQGINVALRDAIITANHLVPAFKGGASADALDAAARAVQDEREPEIKRSQTLQLRDAQGLNTRAAPLLIFMAKHVGKWMGRYRWAQQAWLNQQHDLRFGSTEVVLKV